jgi:hypothetical protein
LFHHFSPSQICFFLTEAKLCLIRLIKEFTKKIKGFNKKVYYSDKMLSNFLAPTITHKRASLFILSRITNKGEDLFRKTLVSLSVSNLPHQEQSD